MMSLHVSGPIIPGSLITNESGSKLLQSAYGAHCASAQAAHGSLNNTYQALFHKLVSGLYTALYEETKG